MRTYNLQREASLRIVTSSCAEHRSLNLSRPIPEYAGIDKVFKSNLTGTCFIICKSKTHTSQLVLMHF